MVRLEQVSSEQCLEFDMFILAVTIALVGTFIFHMVSFLVQFFKSLDELMIP